MTRQPVGTSGKARMLAVMDATGVTEFPVVIPYTGILLRDHWEQVTDVPWWAVHTGDVDACLQVAGDLQEKLQVDWMSVEPSYPRAWRDRHEVRLRAGDPLLVDTETGRESPIAREPVGGMQDTRAGSRVRSIEDIDRLVPVSGAEEILESGVLDCARGVVERFGDQQFIVASIDEPFWRMNRYFGLHDMLTNLIEHPDWVERVLELATLASLEELKAYSQIGVDGVWVECAYTSADMISLEHFRRFAAPYVSRQIELVNRLGMKSVCYFCGDPGDRLEDLVGMAPACLAFEENKKGYGLDIERIERAIAGRACLLGNVDAVGVLQEGTRREMAAEIERQLDVGRRSGRFVMSLGSPVTPSTPIPKVAEFVGLARERTAKG